MYPLLRRCVLLEPVFPVDLPLTLEGRPAKNIVELLLRGMDFLSFLTMQPIAYCRTCLILVATAATPEDRTRLDALLDTWTPGGELLQQQGTCARCGLSGEVSYYGAAE